MIKNTIEVCYSPGLFPLYNHKNSIVVVIDVLRATSSICVAFEYGVERIIPLATIEESLTYRDKGYIVAAERHGEMISGFDFGNSPFSYMNPELEGKSIAMTTTNGTQAIDVAKNSDVVVIGSFLNLNALCEWLNGQDKNVICLCAGWQNKFSMEDTLFAGAVVQQLKDFFRFTTNCDSAIAAEYLYNLAKDDLFGFLENSSHRKRLAKLGIEKDIAYCLTPNQTKVIPVLRDNHLVNAAKLNTSPQIINQKS